MASPKGSPSTPELPSFETFFYNSPVPMKVLDTQNIIHYANPAFEHLLARSEDSLRHNVERDLIHPVDLYRFRERFRALANHQTEYSETEARHRHADGHWVPNLLNHMWLTNPDAPQEFILEIVVDLSQPPARDQATSYNESKQLLGQMARGVAHDFNNLLTVIMTKFELLEMGGSDSDSFQTIVQDTREVLTRMQKLSNHLARFGEEQPDQAEDLDVNAAIGEMREYFNYISPRSVTFAFELGDALPMLQASSMQLEQILLNLVVNACDAIVAKEKSGTVKLSTTFKSFDPQEQSPLDLEPGDYVVISVHDDGMGMDEETQKRLFEPYFTTKGDAGTGIGMSTVFAIVEQGRGYIDVDSAPGKGTRLDVYLPAAAQA